MFLPYIFVFIIHAKINWSYLVLPFDIPPQAGIHIPQNLQNVSEPLIITPYLKSNETSKARKLSSVESFLENENIVSNAGYFTVDEKYNSNLFFWFFRQNSSKWQEAPLLLWLSGGPGSSSMLALFEENGPYTITDDGLEKRDYSWTNDYNVIYIDQPVGTGFSFTKSPDGRISTQEKVADHLFEALTQFFQLYPELRSNEFYITGESYAGKYIPAISYKIHTMKKANMTDINLKGLFIISGLTTGSYDGWANFCFEIGIIDSQTKTHLEGIEKMIKSYVTAGMWKNATHSRNIDLMQKVVSKSQISLYDFRKQVELPKETCALFLSKSAIRKKIHVGSEKFNSLNTSVQDDFFEDLAKSVIPWIEELINHYPIAFVGGQFDVVVPYPLVVNVMENLNWSGASKYKTAVRKIFNEDTVDGYIKSAGNLKDVLIRNAGHGVPRDQPRATYDLLNKFVNGEL